MILPKYMFFTRGVGYHKDKLLSFELALRDAKIAPYNHVKISSILPPGCKEISVEEGLKKLKHGQIVFGVMALNSINGENEKISSSVGLAIPNNKDKHGYFSEYEDMGKSEEDVSRYNEGLAKEMLSTMLGESEKIKEVKNITKTAVSKKGVWTTVIAAAIFC